MVRGTPAQVALAEKLINDFDKPPSEVVIDIAVMQVNRDKLRDLGLNPVSSGANPTATVSLNPNVNTSTTNTNTTTTGTTTSTGTTNGQINLNKFTHLNATDFTVTEDGRSGRSIFIFATLDGTISGWNPTVGLANPATGATHATIAANRSSAGATYTGLAIATNQAGTFLYAADGGPNRRIDMFDGTFHLVKSFADPDIPKGFTPYGIQTINGNIWVTFTALNKAQGGFVDVFDTEGNLVKHFAVHGPLHSPWGIALAPADFGPMSNAILISNNITRGRINAFNPETGQFLGPLRDANGKVIEVDNIWALQFGQDAAANGAHNQLFFTAGPDSYANGLFGVITVGP